METLDKLATTSNTTVDHASNSAHKAIDKVSEAARPTVARIAAGAHQAVDSLAGVATKAVDTFGTKGGQLKDVQARVSESCRAHVRDKPLRSLGYAVAAGFALSWLFNRR